MELYLKKMRYRLPPEYVFLNSVAAGFASSGFAAYYRQYKAPSGDLQEYIKIHDHNEEFFYGTLGHL